MWLLSCHTSGSACARKALPVSKVYLLPGVPDPSLSLSSPTRVPSPLRWRAPLLDLRCLWPGPQSPVCTRSHPTGTGSQLGRAGPSSRTEGFRREGGAVHAQPIRSTQGGTASFMAQSRKAGLLPLFRSQVVHLVSPPILCLRLLLHPPIL